MDKEEQVSIPKWYIKALLILIALQLLISLASIALNLWINFKINRVLWNGGPID